MPLHRGTARGNARRGWERPAILSVEELSLPAWLFRFCEMHSLVGDRKCTQSFLSRFNYLHPEGTYLTYLKVYLCVCTIDNEESLIV